MSWSSSDFRPSPKLTRKNGVPEGQKPLGFKKRETEVYVGNLPLDISESFGEPVCTRAGVQGVSVSPGPVPRGGVAGPPSAHIFNVPRTSNSEEILHLLKDFNPLHVHKVQNGCKCFAFVDLGCVQKVALAVQELNGKFFHKRKLYVNSNRRSSKRTPDLAEGPLELPALEEVSGEGFAKPPACRQLIPKAPADPCETERPRTSFAVPMEMRGPSLALLLQECFPGLGWPAGARGEAGLLVTSIIPQTPFFWAMHVTEHLHQNMEALFRALAEAEERQPYLEGCAVRRGTRCLAEYHLGDHGRAWNRCWVLDRVDSWAVVRFVDFGQSATIPVQSLRGLDSDDFWTIPPLAQPFMLEEGILSSCQVIHHILKGKITGAVNSEPHILKFEEFK